MSVGFLKEKVCTVICRKQTANTIATVKKIEKRVYNISTIYFILDKPNKLAEGKIASCCYKYFFPRKKRSYDAFLQRKVGKVVSVSYFLLEDSDDDGLALVLRVVVAVSFS